MNQIIEKIKNDIPSYRSIPFWSWNDKLEPEELKRQMRNMKDLGMGGGFMHARAGLETEYMSDDWFNCINECIDEAERLGMEAWSYDENGWPSGFAGGILLKDRKNLGIGIYEKTGSFPKDDDLVVAVYKKNPDGTFTQVTEDGGCDDYSIIWKKYDVRYVDTLNLEVTKKFIAVTHEEYKKRIPKEKFGKGKPMPGFFTDEPQYCRWGNPYSDTLPEQFMKAYGYSVYEALPAIFHDYKGSDKHRYDYHYLLHKLFINNFIKPIYDWCEENDVLLTGHAVEEQTLTTQMWCCGGCMPFYEYESIPGVDYLGRGIQTDLTTKQLGSVCAQLGKKKALSEMFACVGWDVSPIELKKIADMQYSNGVNLMCQHLYPYSERGQRKRDYPLHYSEHNSWQEDMADFDRYFTNLGSALSQGDEYSPLLVIHPMHSAYLNYRKDETYDKFIFHGIKPLEDKLFELIELLASNQVPYHFGDEWMMERYAHVENGKITVGKKTYEAVLIPLVYTLDSNTVALLKKLIEEGGKVYIYDQKPYYIDGCDAGDKLDFLKSTMTFEDVLALRDVKITHNGNSISKIRKMTRITPDGRLVYITNIGTEDLYPVKVELPKGNWALLDMNTLEVSPLSYEDTTDASIAEMYFREGESYAFIETSSEHSSSKPNNKPIEDYIPIPDALTLTEKPLNVITLDYVERSDDGINYDEPMFLMGVKTNLLRERYDGKVWLRFSYNVAEGYVPDNLRVAIEPMYDRVFVNGTELFPTNDNWWFDRHIETADIAPYTHSGRNEIIVEATHYQRDYVYYVLYSGEAESLRNCLLFDTEIENIYIIGDFGVLADAAYSDGERNTDLYSGSFTITSQPSSILSYDAVRSGFPFYGGKLKTKFSYNYSSGMPTVLKSDGRNATVDVSVNGKHAGKMLFIKELDLSPFLTEGENRIDITICNSARNIMGPHHRTDPEPIHIGPQSFSFEKEWKGRECKDFVDRYSFVKFGLKKQ